MPNLFPALERISDLLDPDERQSVLGDIQERGITWRSAFDLTGLVLLRQFQAIASWKTWVTGAALFFPAIFIAGSTLRIALYLDHPGRYRYPSYPWALIDVPLLTWAVGFALSSLGRRGSLIVLTALPIAVWLTESNIYTLLTSSYWGPRTSWESIAATFALLVVVPGAHGFLRGLHRRPLSQAVAAPLLILGAASAWNSYPLPLASQMWDRLLWAAAVIWPAIYALTRRVKEHSHAT